MWPTVICCSLLLLSAAPAASLPCETATFRDNNGGVHSCHHYKFYGYCVPSHRSYPFMEQYCSNTCAGCKEEGGEDLTPLELLMAAPAARLPCETATFQDNIGGVHSCHDYKFYGYCAPSHDSYPFMEQYCSNTCAGCREEGGEDLTPLELLTVPGAGQLFRTKPCSAIPSVSSPALAKLRLEEPGPGPRIACVVYSYHKYRQRLRDAFATWGQDCDTFLAFSDRKFKDEEAGLETFEVHPDSYDQMAVTIWRVLEEVRGRVAAGTLSFDFLTMSDDDSFWIMPNLRHYLRTDTAVARAQGLLLGHRMVVPWDNSTVFAHGGGFVMDKAALDALSTCQLPLNESNGPEPYIARCLREVDIFPLASEDEHGAQRFNLFDDRLSTEINYESTVFTGSRFPEWLMAYHKPLLPLKGGLEGISEHSVLFHYSTGHRRLEMHDGLYWLRYCAEGRVS